MIYRITSPAGKAYVGQTRKPLSVRMRWHTKHPGCKAVHAAISKYGIQNMRVSVLASGLPTESLNAFEAVFVSVCRSLSPNGYNLASGGNAALVTSPTTRAKMSASGVKSWAVPGERARRGAILRKSIRANLALRARRSEMSKALRARPEDKAASSLRMSLFWANPENKAARSEAMRGRKLRGGNNA